MKNHTKIGFLNNTGSNPLKNHKLPSQHSMLGQQGHASERHLNDCPLIVIFDLCRKTLSKLDPL